MHSKEEIFDKVKAILVETFELDAMQITMGAHLYRDLDLDSIDAIDLAVKFESETGVKLQEKELTEIRTVSDVVDVLHTYLSHV